MIEAKDVARKIAAGCNHSAPIYIPCSGCIESNIAAWERSVREDVMVSVRERWKNTEEESRRVAEKNKALLESLDKEKAARIRVEQSNRELAARLKDAGKTIDDLKMCLATEQGEKIREATSARIASSPVAMAD